MAIKSNQHVIKTKNYCNNYMLGNRILRSKRVVSDRDGQKCCQRMEYYWLCERVPSWFKRLFASPLQLSFCHLCDKFACERIYA